RGLGLGERQDGVLAEEALEVLARLLGLLAVLGDPDQRAARLRPQRGREPRAGRAREPAHADRAPLARLEERAEGGERVEALGGFEQVRSSRDGRRGSLAQA